MTLDEFIAEEHRRLDEFKAYYIKSMQEAQDETIWSESMSPGDWFEQYLSYCGVDY